MAQVIRDVVTTKFGADTAASLRVQYGGSVNAANCGDFLTLNGIDGALVGGASLKAQDFAAIVESVSK